ncbi:MAG: hypothetical protein NC253_08125 [Ruminococcus sp.]|nr:hypothetical protein [Ruminococcus sp.]MCM1382021.1 hypothetical protein [Muribaculaceae bacterium]MCM1479381.1 hypothetical protein [Muribaculaceae bacterium]
MKRENSEIIKTVKSRYYAGLLTAAMGLLFISAFLWTDDNVSPVKSIAAGIIFLIAGTFLILRARSAGKNSEK